MLYYYIDELLGCCIYGCVSLVTMELHCRVFVHEAKDLGNAWNPRH
jgi:hypothetical protein